MSTAWDPPTLTPLGRVAASRCVASRILLCVLVVHIGIALIGAVVVRGQMSEATHERQRVIVDSLVSRVDRLEGQRFDARMSVLESDMYEVKWLGRGMAGTYLLHLMFASWKKKDEV